ncbi:MAG: ATP-binding protein [Gammaproteobacteria bacterium]|nr:ATP-binding protein [Gammaproteobacteria bacterium]
MKLNISIKTKVIITQVIAITVMIGLITFTMANLFHEDKSSYIRDLTSVMAQNTASEANVTLQAYQQRLQIFAQLVYQGELSQSSKLILLKDIFRDSQDMLSISIYEDGAELATVIDSERLLEMEIDQRKLEQERTQNLPLTSDATSPGQISLKPGESHIMNSSMSSKLPTITFYLRPILKNNQNVIISAVISLEQLLSLAQRSDVINMYIIDAKNTVLVHSDRELVLQRALMKDIPDLTALQQSNIGTTSLEYNNAQLPMVGGFSQIGSADLIAVAELPESRAYLSAKELLTDLTITAMTLLVIASLLGVTWARYLTNPIIELSEATKKVATGDFEVRVAHQTNDELGKLADSFNTMTQELDEREKELKEAQSALIQSEKMSAFGQISAGIAHEVKNPLASILGFTQLIKRKIDADNPVQQKLDVIARETKRCSEIVTNLMRFTRQETAEHAPEDMNQIIKQSLEIVGHQLEHNQIEVETHLADPAPKIKGNANQLQQILLNLAINAEQAMETSVKKKFEITTQVKDENTLEVYVSDTGPGIPEENRSKLFEPFFTTKPAGEGTGLGLSVSYGIIEDHKGHISIIDQPGKGAVFKIELPIYHEGQSHFDTEQSA